MTRDEAIAYLERLCRGSGIDPEDVYQSLAERFRAKRRSVDEIFPLALANQFRNHLERAKSQKRGGHRLGHDILRSDDDCREPRYADPKQATPDVIAERRESAGWVRSNVAALPREQHDVIELIYFKGCTWKEAAERLGLPRGTVASRVNRA